jgi:hypothetical protein
VGRGTANPRGDQLTKGRIIVRGKLVTLGQAKRADYILYHKPSIQLARLEAKDNSYRLATGCNRRSITPLHSISYTASERVVGQPGALKPAEAARKGRRE